MCAQSSPSTSLVPIELLARRKSSMPIKIKMERQIEIDAKGFRRALKVDRARTYACCVVS